jgi:hypothetical protein
MPSANELILSARRVWEAHPLFLEVARYGVDGKMRINHVTVMDRRGEVLVDEGVNPAKDNRRFDVIWDAALVGVLRGTSITYTRPVCVWQGEMTRLAITAELQHYGRRAAGIKPFFCVSTLSADYSGSERPATWVNAHPQNTKEMLRCIAETELAVLHDYA